MSLYIHVIIEVQPGMHKKYMSNMARAVSLLQELGWNLTGSYAMRTGKWNTMLHVWQLPDMSFYEASLKKYVSHPDFPEIKRGIDETVISETTTFAAKFSYPMTSPRVS